MPSRLRRLLFACVLACAAAGPLAAEGIEILDIQISPPEPTADDQLTLTVTGVSESPCFGIEGVELAGRDIYVNFSPCFTPPPLQETPVHVSEEIGSLAPGTYRVRVVFGASIIAEKEFRVRTGPIFCPPAASTVCLHENRFQFFAVWEANGDTGDGQGIQLTGDTGAFTFFQPSNIEVLFKVVDGCALNGHYWVFAAGLTNVRVSLHVSDVVFGNEKTYVNRAGRPFTPIQDTAAFPCQ